MRTSHGRYIKPGENWAVSRNRDNRGDKAVCQVHAACRGWSLIEVVVVMSVAAALIGVTVTMLSGIFRAGRQGMDHMTQAGVINRLAEQFRADVAAARSCQPLVGAGAEEAEKKSGIVLKSAGQDRVEYVATAQVLERIAYAGENVDRRETYQLGPARRARLEIEQGKPNVVNCVLEQIESSPGFGEPTSGPISISAILGRNQRFRKPEAETVGEPSAVRAVEPAEKNSAESEGI